MAIRIKNGHYYVRAEHPGISGFQDWSRKVESVCAAPKARNNRLSIVREYLANGLRSFRLCDGHLPEHQPIVREVDALRWLDENPFSEIVEV